MRCSCDHGEKGPNETMAKKQPAKRAFDWRTYSKPVRLLTEVQEVAFAGGDLAPLMSWTAADPRSRFEIRARSAGLYHRGVSLARISGEGPFIAEVDAGTGPGDRAELAGPQDVTALVTRLEDMRQAIDADANEPGVARNRRSYAHGIAAGNAGQDLDGDTMVVVDADYALGRRKLDLVALLRSEGVTGAGGFASPDLSFIDVRVPGQSLTGPGGLSALADDLADFGKALSGEHIRRAAAEIAELTRQKVRLGLLPRELDVRSVTETLPHLIVAFAEVDPSDPRLGAAILEVQERLASRHYPTHRLRFAHFTLVPEDGDGAALGEGDAMQYREFKSYRLALRSEG